ncbi:hypothetical protein [Plantactinospora endophytica]|uniref:hypothetical protein n=1 Tax=Plantactinospora endophytica TaxID=673535 RepID=UPI00194055F2|nr:hypothetical protein [Plantactinospora endophytica]
MIFAAMILMLVGYLARVGLDRADKVGSAAGMVLALTALFAPHLLPIRDSPVTGPDRAEHTGPAVASAGGNANTGLRSGGNGRPARVSDTGSATARGPGSRANTGIVRGVDPQR